MREIYLHMTTNYYQPNLNKDICLKICESYDVQLLLHICTYFYLLSYINNHTCCFKNINVFCFCNLCREIPVNKSIFKNFKSCEICLVISSLRL